MIPQPVKTLLQHATAVEWRAVGAAAASGAAILALTVGLSAARSSPVGSDEGARRIAAATQGDLREGALEALVAGMDPAAATLGRRFDPLAFTPALPITGFEADDPRLLFLQEAESAEARRLNASIPFALDGIPAAAPFVLKASSTAERERAVRCLTNAIYYEAALEPLDGQRAVAQVVLNRVRDPNFPKSICGVVYQGWERLTGCQFSFTCDGALVREPLGVLWREQRKVAEAALAGHVAQAVGTATHYHADYVSPYWGPSLVKLTKIGAHIFYRWPGDAGQPGAFTASYAGGELRLSEAVLSGRAARRAALIRAAAPAAAALPGVRTVAMANGKGGVSTRVHGSFAAVEYGRRSATPDEIARINALLEQRFPTKPAETVPEPAPTPAPAPAAAAPLPQAVSVAEPPAAPREG